MICFFNGMPFGAIWKFGNLANRLDTKIDDANVRNKQTYSAENEETYPTEKQEISIIFQP